MKGRKRVRKRNKNKKGQDQGEQPSTPLPADRVQARREAAQRPGARRVSFVDGADRRNYDPTKPVVELKAGPHSDARKGQGKDGKGAARGNRPWNLWKGSKGKGRGKDRR